MKNYVTSGGLLQEGDEQGQLYSQGKMQRDALLESQMPFVPQNQQELVMMQRTMIPAGQNESGLPQFTTPEKAIYDRNKIKMQQLQGKAQQDYDRKVNNPLFKIGDFAADVARNTIGAPINFLTDGVGFQMDPSEDSKRKFESRLEELDQLQELNAKSFYGGRSARAAAFDSAVTNRLGKNASGINANNINNINPRDYTVDSVSKFQISGNFKDLERYDSIERVKDANGIVRMFDKSNSQYIGQAYGADSVGEDAAEISAIKKFDDYRVDFKRTFNKQYQRIRGVMASRKILEGEIAKVIPILEAGKGAGLQSLLASIPTTDANRVKNILSTVQANIAFDRLQKMRDDSVTGGALGNVSDSEITLLMNSLTQLSNAQTPEALLESLEVVMRKNHEYLGLMEDSFVRDLHEYGGDREMRKINEEGFLKYPPITIGGEEYNQLPVGPNSTDDDDPEYLKSLEFINDLESKDND